MVPLEEEEFSAPLSRSRRRKRRSQQPPLSWSRWKEGDALSLYKRFFTLLFFLKNAGDSSCPFSHKCGRFVGLETNFDCFRVLFIVRFYKLNCLLIGDCCQLHVGKGIFYVIFLFLIIFILITKCTHSYIFRFTY
jgi:hypothetical protein